MSTLTSLSREKQAPGVSSHARNLLQCFPFLYSLYDDVMTADTLPIGTLLDEARRTLHLTWNEVATAARITPQALRQIRHGNAIARPSTLRQLETVLQLPPMTLSQRVLDGPTIPAGEGPPNHGANLPETPLKMVIHFSDESRSQVLLIQVRADKSEADLARLTHILQVMADLLVSDD